MSCLHVASQRSLAFTYQNSPDEFVHLPVKDGREINTETQGPKHVNN